VYYYFGTFYRDAIWFERLQRPIRLEKITIGGYELIDGFVRVPGEKPVYGLVYRDFS
jgi:hypothetical protein